MKKLTVLGMLMLCWGCGSAPEAVAPEASWAQLSHFACKPGAASIQIPRDVLALNDREIRLSGYMAPLETEGERVLSFILVRDQMLCCFGKMPALNEWVYVKTDGVPAVLDSPVRVTGIFQAREEREKGQVITLYRLQGKKVERLQNVSKG